MINNPPQTRTHSPRFTSPPRCIRYERGLMKRGGRTLRTGPRILGLKAPHTRMVGCQHHGAVKWWAGTLDRVSTTLAEYAGFREKTFCQAIFNKAEPPQKHIFCATAEAVPYAFRPSHNPFSAIPPFPTLHSLRIQVSPLIPPKIHHSSSNSSSVCTSNMRSPHCSICSDAAAFRH